MKYVYKIIGLILFGGAFYYCGLQDALHVRAEGLHFIITMVSVSVGTFLLMFDF